MLDVSAAEQLLAGAYLGYLGTLDIRDPGRAFLAARTGRQHDRTKQRVHLFTASCQPCMLTLPHAPALCLPPTHTATYFSRDPETDELKLSDMTGGMLRELKGGLTPPSLSSGIGTDPAFLLSSPSYDVGTLRMHALFAWRR